MSHTLAYALTHFFSRVFCALPVFGIFFSYTTTKPQQPRCEGRKKVMLVFFLFVVINFDDILKKWEFVVLFLGWGMGTFESDALFDQEDASSEAEAEAPKQKRTLFFVLFFCFWERIKLTNFCVFVCMCAFGFVFKPSGARLVECCARF